MTSNKISVSDCHLLEDNLRRQVIRVELLSLSFDLPKCSVMTFLVVLMFLSIILTTTVSNDSVKDLGFSLARNPCLSMYTQTIRCKALELLGFINHDSAEFRLFTPLKRLFCSLVRLIPEYMVSHSGTHPQLLIV